MVNPSKFHRLNNFYVRRRLLSMNIYYVNHQPPTPMQIESPYRYIPCMPQTFHLNEGFWSELSWYADEIVFLKTNGKNSRNEYITCKCTPGVCVNCK